MAVGVVLAGAACAENSGASNGGGGPSVDLGAAKQAYVNALEDMEPVTLMMQSSAPKGSSTGRRFEAYAAAVEEWSGGKITFELAYSNAVAPPDEVDDALLDGRLDVGSVIVALEPSEYPVNNVLWDLSFVGSQEPVEGLLEWHGAMLEAAMTSDAIQQEFEEHGMYPLLPTFSSGSYFLNCAEPGTSTADFEGRSIATQSRIQGSEAEALEMSPTTISYEEMFESLERGVIDCAASTLTVSTLGGFIPQAPYFAYSPEVGLASPGGSLAISLERWESLPLAARQLLHDRMDVVLEANFEATWDNVAAGLDAIEQAGGEVSEIDAEAAEALEGANTAAIEEARGSDETLVDALLDAEEDWTERVEGLGIEGVDVTYADFADWHAGGPPQLQAYFDEIADVMAARRPS
jgi:TRAP-type C4-dicarboxylate transport system substrate-binding protein